MAQLDSSFVQYANGILASIPCTYAEFRAAERDTTLISLSGENIENLSSGTGVSGSIRIFDRGSWSFISFNSLKELAAKAKRVKEIAELLEERSDCGILRSNPIRVHYKTECEVDFKKISFDEKFALLNEYNDILRGHKKVQTTRATYRDTISTDLFLNTDGAELLYEKSHCGISMASMVKDGSEIQSYHDSVAGYGGYEFVQNRHKEAEHVTRIAVELLDAEVVEGGKYQVVLDPHLTGVFIHEAFGHLSEADFVYENERMREVMTLGTQFGIESLNVVDYGNIEKESGFIPLDDEGVVPEKTYLIKDGVLSGRLHSRETAFKMKEELTGNARAISPMVQPIVRMTNTYIENGASTKEEIFDAVEDGIYAIDAFGGQTNLEMFTFSAAYGRKIKNGKPGKMVKNVMLSGNVFETLKNIEKIGNDMQLFGGLGGCGKGGQGPLPVSFGGPHLLINNVLIGGSQ